MAKDNKRYTPAQKKAIYKHQDKIDRLYITVPAGKKDKIREHADSQGESVNSFVVRAIDETIERDKEEKGSSAGAPDPE